MSVVDSSFDQPLYPEERATIPFAGGLLQKGYQCGMLWGAVLAAGAQAYQRFGTSLQSETAAVVAAERLVRVFQTNNKHIDCADIIEMDWKSASQPGFGKQVLKFFLRGGPVSCFRMAARYAPVVREEIEQVYLETDLNGTLSEPASCAALTARKMGASQQHAIMAAGFAGGIGLSGSACGALGVAIWLKRLDRIQAGNAQVEMVDPQADRVFESFLTLSDYGIECQEIVGRKFVDVGEHAAYLRSGGCTQIIEGLAALG